MKIGEALIKQFKTIFDMLDVLKTNKDCIKFLEELIWEDVPVSPFDYTSKVYKCKNGRYKCKNTNKYFNILTGTIFENTKIPIRYWFVAIYEEQVSRKGIASTELAKRLNITQSAAWYMLQKIRKCMKKENFQKLKGTVEVDEFHAGGSLKNMHYNKKLEAREKGIFQNKTLLQGFVKRGGDAVIRLIPDKTDSTLIAGILRHVEHGSTLYSDDNPSYQKVPSLYNQANVVHSKGNYVSKDDKNVHTNTIESVWATLSRTIETYIHVSKKHTQNYANETTFRYNTRKMEPIDALIWLLQNLTNTRITRKEILLGIY